MIQLPALFAQATLPLDNVSVHGMTTLLREVMIVTGAAAGVTLLVVVWAVYFRRRRRHHSHHSHHHHHHHHPSPQPAENDLAVDETASETGVDSSEPHRHRRRRRRRRREHRPRNPTLAETGGLPPLRSEQPPESLS